MLQYGVNAACITLLKLNYKLFCHCNLDETVCLFRVLMISYYSVLRKCDTSATKEGAIYEGGFC